MQPTQFRNWTKNFKIEFPGNQDKIFDLYVKYPIMKSKVSDHFKYPIMLKVSDQAESIRSWPESIRS